jgi:hypothetical protein
MPKRRRVKPALSFFDRLKMKPNDFGRKLRTSRPDPNETSL